MTEKEILGPKMARQQGTAMDRPGMTPGTESYRSELIAIAKASPWFMHALKAAASLGLGDWCIGAGAIRILVWDHLHAHPVPSKLVDIDLCYFDLACPEPATERRLQALLHASTPDLPWEVTNQATVHRWFKDRFGHAVAPLQSLKDGVASWPEYATCVGITLDAASDIQVIAPWGLDDLFAMRVRHNPARASQQAFVQRTQSKRYALRWPRVRVET